MSYVRHHAMRYGTPATPEGNPVARRAEEEQQP
ncbi:hypothetical protein FHR81_000293 [Actinoalloteichus hoggarensis]|nr:hypothetical protein [Actinoalloteichus hoggarensis]